MIRSFFASAALLLISGPALAWGPLGHRLVADLAWDDMSPRARAEAQKLLKGEAEPTLAGIANWADELRNTDAALGKKTAHWHYVNIAENSDMGPDGAGTGVHVDSFGQDAKNGEVVYDPSNPLADADGNIRRADVNLSEQMGDMIMAQRAFQANASNIGRAKDAYEAAINIGKGI